MSKAIFQALSFNFAGQVTSSTKFSRPKYYARFINTHVYEQIENGLVLEKLRELDPLNEKQQRRHRLHQFLNEKLGLRVLRDRISKITALMQISPNMRRLKESYERMESKQLWFNFPDD